MNRAQRRKFQKQHGQVICHIPVAPGYVKIAGDMYIRTNQGNLIKVKEWTDEDQNN